MTSKAQPRRRATRADVAREAGTSTAVVSYVLNNGPRPVAEATRKRVLAAAELTGYQPDGIARALASGATKTLGLIAPDLSNPFFTALAHALEEEAAKRGLVFLLGDSGENPARQQELIASFVGRRVDALVIVGVGSSLDLTVARRAAVPVVVLDRSQTDPELTTVGIDNRAAARAATSHLIDHGCEHLALISGPEELNTAVARANGWLDAMDEHALEISPSRIHRTGFNRAAGYRAGRALLSGEEPVDGAFVASEQQATGLLRAAHELGVTIPEELCVVAFDGTEASEFCIPSLTTIAQPFAELAAHTLDLIATPSSDARSIVSDFELIRRESCGCTRSLHEQEGTTR